LRSAKEAFTVIDDCKGMLDDDSFRTESGANPIKGLSLFRSGEHKSQTTKDLGLCAKMNLAPKEITITQNVVSFILSKGFINELNFLI
jgi:hypothetical protein